MFDKGPLLLLLVFVFLGLLPNNVIPNCSDYKIIYCVGTALAL